MKVLLVCLAVMMATMSLGGVGCAPAAPAATPTKAPAAATKAPEATKPAAATTKPAEATKPAAQPTAAAAPAKKVDFPEKGKAITVINPWPAGAGTDVGARLLASLMEKDLGTSIQVVNKVGASGQVGQTELARSKPDGYTFGVMGAPACLTVYLDPDRQAAFNRDSFEPLAMQVDDPSVIAVMADSPYKTLKDLVDTAKASPDKITAASSGILTNSHFTSLQLSKVAGARFSLVHTDGGAQALTTFLGGHVDALFGNLSQMPPHVKAGTVRVLAILDKQPSKFLPDVRTAEAQGYPVYMSAPRGYSAPAGVPKEIVNVLSDSMKRATATEEHTKKMEESFLTLRFLDAARYKTWWIEYETSLKDLMALAGTQKK